MDLSPWGGLKSGSSLWPAVGSGFAAGPLSRLSGSDAGAVQTSQQSPRHHVPAPLTVRAPPTNAFGGIARRGEPVAEAASVLAAAQRRANKTEPFVSPFGAASGMAAALAAIAALNQQQQKQPLNGAPPGPAVQRPVPQHAAALSMPMSPGHGAAADATQQAQQAVTALINNALLEVLVRGKAEQALRAQQQGQQGLLFAESAAAALALAAVPTATQVARPAARLAVQSAASRQWVGIMRTSLIASPVSLAAVGLRWADEVGLGEQRHRCLFAV